MIEFHPISNIFPMLDGDKAKSLVRSIATDGLLVPITLFEGKILDGRNRYLACIDAKVEPKFSEFTGDYAAALQHVWNLNFERRQLNASQAACADAERNKLLNAYEALREDAKHKQEAGKGSDGSGGRGKKKVENLPQLIGEPKADKHMLETSAKRAEIAQTNRTYIDAADKLLAENPKKFEEVKQGKKTLTQVQREIKKEELSARVVQPLAGKYRIIYADPPWKYNDQQVISKDGTGENYGPADAHYPQMTIDELCTLPVLDIAEDNSVLFLWTTSPLLESSFKIIHAWGFKYKSSFIWDKVKHNMGHYNSVRHEFLLVATRGSCLPDNPKLYDSVQSIERTAKHSQKPEEFRAIIDDLYTNGARIELFSREPHENWESWGNEA